MLRLESLDSARSERLGRTMLNSRFADSSRAKKALSDQKALAKTLSTFARLRFLYFYFLCRLSLFKFTKEKKMFLIPRNPRMNALLCSIDATSALSIVSPWLKNDTAMDYGIARATLTEEPRVTRWQSETDDEVHAVPPKFSKCLLNIN